MVALDRQGGGVASRPDGSWETFEDHWLWYAGDLIWTGSGFVAVGCFVNPDAPPYVVVGTSSDGSSWSWEGDFGAGFPYAMALFNGQMVVVGSGSTLGLSRDGLTWKWRTEGSVVRIVANAATPDGLLAFEAGVLLWPGNYPGGMPARFGTSPDGLNFVWVDLGLDNYVGGVAWHGATDVAVGFPRVLLREDSGPWVPLESPAAEFRLLNAVTWGDPGFVAVGSGSTLIHSPDGWEWTRADLVVDSGFDDVVWTGERYVAVGPSIRYLYYPAVAVSTDGVVWELIPEPFVQRQLALAATDDLVVGVGVDGAISTSLDGGLTWSSEESGTDETLLDVAWTGRELLAVGGGGTVLTSADGHTWQAETTGYGSYLYRAAALGDREVVSGAGLIQVRRLPARPLDGDRAAPDPGGGGPARPRRHPLALPHPAPQPQPAGGDGVGLAAAAGGGGSVGRPGAGGGPSWRDPGPRRRADAPARLLPRRRRPRGGRRRAAGGGVEDLRPGRGGDPGPGGAGPAPGPGDRGQRDRWCCRCFRAAAGSGPTSAWSTWRRTPSRWRWWSGRTRGRSFSSGTSPSRPQLRCR